MKKILVILCLLLLIGCSTKKEEIVEEIVEEIHEEEEDIKNVISPLVEYSSLYEINEITHGNLVKPKSKNISNERYTIITLEDKKIAELAFKLSDIDYFYRFSDQILDGDITGIRHDDLLGFEGIEEPEATIQIDNGRIARWFTVDGQYTLYTRGDISENSFNKIVNELHKSSANQ